MAEAIRQTQRPCLPENCDSDAKSADWFPLYSSDFAPARGAIVPVARGPLRRY
jgi:hypothetical protein